MDDACDVKDCGGIIPDELVCGNFCAKMTTDNASIEHDAVQDDNSKKDEYNDEDLDDILNSMDIDRDFNQWTSFRQSMVSKDSPAENGCLTDDTANHRNAPQKGGGRTNDDSLCKLQREEVFSWRYRPSADERNVLNDIQRLFKTNGRFAAGVRSLLRSTSGGTTLSHEEEATWNQLLLMDQHAHHQPCSILIKRGLVVLVDVPTSTTTTAREAELFLLTHGLLIAHVQETQARKKTVLARNPARALTWDSLLVVRPVHDKNNPNASTSWQMQFVREIITVDCATVQDQNSWLHAFQVVLSHWHMHNSKAKTAPTKQEQKMLGWQYQIVQYPLSFAVAVSNTITDSDAQALRQQEPSTLNALDEHNGYAALHYAVRLGHVQAVRALLQAGADPNVQDGEDDYTPMYYASRDQVDASIVACLQQYGANDSQQAITETSGELFGRVAATNTLLQEKRDKERAEVEAQQKATAAKHQMADNMRLMQERGETINEIGNKASDLNAGAKNFADMARELKEKSKGGGSKKFGLF